MALISRTCGAPVSTSEFAFKVRYCLLVKALQQKPTADYVGSLGQCEKVFLVVHFDLVFRGLKEVLGRATRIKAKVPAISYDGLGPR